MSIILVYNDGKQFRKIAPFLPFLKTIEQYSFPKPTNFIYTNTRLYWLERKLSSFTDPQFLKHLDPVKRHHSIHTVIVDNASDAHIQVVINQKDNSVMLLSNYRPFITVPQIKELFLKLIHEGEQLDYGFCGPFQTNIAETHFPGENDSTMTMLSWLQYYGKAEVEQRGGFGAFESNPYVQTQRIHDGLLVQVGDHIDAWATPEGEALLVHAMKALPPRKR